MQCLLVARRWLSRPDDANVYAEIRKSTLEPESSSQQNNTGHGNQSRLQVPETDGKHDSANSLQDLTLIENSIYRTSGDYTKPSQLIYLPGTFVKFICRTVVDQ